MKKFEIILTPECMDYYTFTKNKHCENGNTIEEAESNFLHRFGLDDDDILTIREVSEG